METSKGKPMHELRRLVAEDMALWDELGEAWTDLLEDEKKSLVIIAQSMAARHG